MRPTARQLARRRETLVAVAQLQRTRWQLAVAQAPWQGSWRVVRAALALWPVLAALWRR